MPRRRGGTGWRPSPWSCAPGCGAPGRGGVDDRRPDGRCPGAVVERRLLRLLADAGFDPVEAARATYLLIVYIFGSIALEVADDGGTGRLPAEGRPARQRRRHFAATPPGSYPLTAAAADTMAGYISTDQYVWGLRRVLDGIVAGSP